MTESTVTAPVIDKVRIRRLLHAVMHELTLTDEASDRGDGTEAHRHTMKAMMMMYTLRNITKRSCPDCSIKEGEENDNILH